MDVDKRHTDGNPVDRIPMESGLAAQAIVAWQRIPGLTWQLRPGLTWQLRPGWSGSSGYGEVAAQARVEWQLMELHRRPWVEWQPVPGVEWQFRPWVGWQRRPG